MVLVKKVRNHLQFLIMIFLLLLLFFNIFSTSASSTHLYFYNWTTTSSYVKSGDTALENSFYPSKNDSSYVLNRNNHQNYSISVWFYTYGSQEMLPGLAIRSDENSCDLYGAYNTAICSGYVLRLENSTSGVKSSHLVLGIVYNGTFRTLATDTLDSWSLNSWIHLKLQAEGPIITGYISQTDTFSNIPAISYDISNDYVNFISGKAGFGSNAEGFNNQSNSGFSVFDDAKISVQNATTKNFDLVLEDSFDYTTTNSSSFYQNWFFNNKPDVVHTVQNIVENSPGTNSITELLTNPYTSLAIIIFIGALGIYFILIMKGFFTDYSDKQEIDDTICENCGCKNLIEDNYCKICGKKLKL